MKKFFLIILSLLMMCSLTLAACKDDDSSHTCESKCSVCQLCTDDDCTDSACSNKCQGHDTHTHSYSQATCLSPATCSCGLTQGDALDCAVLETREGLMAGVCQWCDKKLSVKGDFYQDEYSYEQNGDISAYSVNSEYGEWLVFHDDGTFTKYMENRENITYSGKGIIPIYVPYFSFDCTYMKIDTKRTTESFPIVFLEYEGRLIAHEIYVGDLPEGFINQYAIDPTDLLYEDGERYEDYADQLEEGMTFVLYENVFGGVQEKWTLTLKLVTPGNENNDAVIDYTLEILTTEEFNKSEMNRFDSITYDESGEYYKVICSNLRIRQETTLSGVTYDEESSILTAYPTDDSIGTISFCLYSDYTLDFVDDVEDPNIDETKELFEGLPWGEYFIINYGSDSVYAYGIYEDKIEFVEINIYATYFVCYGEAGDINSSIAVYDYPEIPENYKKQMLGLNDLSSESGFDLEFYDTQGDEITDESLQASVTFGIDGITIIATGEDLNYEYTILYDYVELGFGTINNDRVKIIVYDAEFDSVLEIVYSIEAEGVLSPNKICYWLVGSDA